MIGGDDGASVVIGVMDLGRLESKGTEGLNNGYIDEGAMNITLWSSGVIEVSSSRTCC